ncbi:MAG: anthranilate synthase component I [Actinobacteria bacterium]|nr:anthranilate synthase component I [Actinomycetota bacterium]
MYDIIPVYEELVADFETPVSAFLKLCKDDHAFLLESAETVGFAGRFSFIGCGLLGTIMYKDGKAIIAGLSRSGELTAANPLDLIRSEIFARKVATVDGLDHFFGGAVGYLAYDCIKYFEDLRLDSCDELKLPDALFMVTRTVLVFDHFTRKVKIIVAEPIGDDPSGSYFSALDEIRRIRNKLTSADVYSNKPISLQEALFEFSSNISRTKFEDGVKDAIEYIRSGDIFQVVLSQRFQVKTDVDPFNVYRVLRVINPSPYMYYLSCGDFKIVGSSPEPLVRVTGNRVVTKPIAGTRRRGRDDAEDRLLETELLADEKECAEHVMLVDLGRNDLGRVCKYGSVSVDEFMQIEKYSNVMHMVSEVSGELSEAKDGVDALISTFPAGTVSGAPKIRAMQIIGEIEPVRRGPYAGIVGYFGYNKVLDSCITIRTAVFSDGMAYVQAGAGIVADSVPQNEYLETQNKAKALIRAIKVAEVHAGDTGNR